MMPRQVFFGADDIRLYNRVLGERADVYRRFSSAVGFSILTVSRKYAILSVSSALLSDVAIRFLCKSRQAPDSDNKSCGKRLHSTLYSVPTFHSSAFAPI